MRTVSGASISLAVVTLTLLALPGLAQDGQPATGDPVPADEMPPAPGPVQDAELDSLVGTWSGTGTVMGAPYTDTSTFEWILGHQFLRGHAEATFSLPDGSSGGFSTELTFKPVGEGRYECYYRDSMGNAGPFEAWTEGGTMTTEWQAIGDEPAGRQTFVDQPDGSIAVTYYQQTPDGAWSEIGSATLTRTE